MREIRPSGSEGGVALTTPLLPLSSRLQGTRDVSLVARSNRTLNQGHQKWRLL
jgi:hypothetical protein